MYLFSRSARLAPGNTRESLDWALDITDRVNQITALGVSLYMQVWSPEFGRLAWSCMVPDLGVLEAANDKLLADDGFVAKVDAGARLLQGGVDDTIAQIVHGEPDPDRQPEYATAVRAVCAHGKIQEGLAVGVEIAQRVEAITGVPTMFLAGSTGVFGRVGWLSGHENVQSIDASQAALMADQEWMNLLDQKAGSVYAQEPSPTQVLFRRLA